MKKVLSRNCYLLVPFFALSLVLAGCSGDDGSMGPVGPEGPPGPPGVPGPGAPVPEELGFHEISTPMFNENAAITAVNVQNGNVELTFSVPGYPRDEVRAELTLAKWVEEKGSWMSMLPRAVADANNPTVGNVIRGGNLRMEGATALIGEGGTFTTTLMGAGNDFGGANPIDFSDGAVWRRANEAQASTYAPEEGAYRDFVQGIIDDINTFGAWEDDAVYKVTVTSRTNAGQPERFNAVAYFKGDGTAVTDPGVEGVRLIDIASCNTCHGERVTFNAHGGQRHDPNVCANCHNDYTFDRGIESTDTPDGWARLSLTNMIHKIHSGIPGYTVDSKPFEQVRFPDYTFARDGQPRNCTACHIGDVPAAGESWNRGDVTVAVACASCHVEGGASFRANHEANNWFNCSTCHENMNGFAQTPDAYHGISAKLDEIAAAADYQLEIIRVENAVAGSAPTVIWSVKDSTGNARTLAVDDFAGHLRIGIGWGFGDDWVNDGVVRASGASGDPLAVVLNADNTDVDGTQITTTLPALPANAEAERNGYVTIMPIEIDGVFTGIVAGDARVKPNTVVGTFTLGEDVDNLTNERREIVSAAKCNDCHNNLERHGTRANADVMGCVACHNAGSLSRNASEVQGTVDFMYIIHAIHSVGEKRERFDRRRDHGYTHITNANTILDCNACHVNDSQQFPADPTKRLGVIGDSPIFGENSPMGSVCYSCHQETENLVRNLEIKGHITANGGEMFGNSEFEDYVDGFRAESCTFCHN